MQEYISTLFLLPFIGAAVTIAAPKYAAYAVSVVCSFLIAAAVLAFVYYDAAIKLSLPWLSIPFLIADFLLLAYFVYVGYKTQNKKILLLALTQLAILLAVENFETKEGFDLVIDKLSVFMFLLINVVGSVILLYSIRYVKDETSDIQKAAKFLAILTAFLGVMNLLVSADNSNWLFLFFELTTLASFWLIGFRNDEISRQNAQNALWMNQIGGVALILAVLIAKSQLHTVYISELLTVSGAYIMLICALIAVSAMIKGAQMPFSSWLLGAMVAPTPVSAILHSSTMVKIAPYLILKISPVISGTLVGMGVSLIGALSFLVCAVLALKEDSFKKILAYSTISLLGLMILTASLGTPLTLLACLLLIIFHGVSKAMLFMCAGILEKRYHLKQISDIEGLITKAPVLTSLITLGFLSIALPPFGVFFAKWITYEGSAAQGLFTVFLILFIAVGSVALTLLYFKTVGRFVANDRAAKMNEDTSYLITPASLGVILLVFALFVSPIIGNFFVGVAEFLSGKNIPMRSDFWGIVLPFGTLYFWHIAAAFLLLALSPIVASKLKLKNVDIAKPYSCGERIETNAYSFYFEPIGHLEDIAKLVSIGLFVAVIVAGALNL